MADETTEPKSEETPPPEEAPKKKPPKGVPQLDQEKEEHARGFFFPKWSQEYINLIKATCCPPGIPNAEFAMFVEQCRKAELDPMKGEADCVPRKSKVVTQLDNGQTREDWVTKWVFQPREAGMLARADRFPDFRGIKAAAVYEKDAIEIDEVAGTVKHVSKPLDPNRGKIVGAWAFAIREGRQLPVEWVRFGDYAQNTSMWQAKGHTMIVKCARAAALRRAYPNTFGSSYLPEELEGAELALPAVTEAKRAAAITDGADRVKVEIPASRTATVAEKVAAKAAAVQAQPAPAAAPPPAPLPADPPKESVGSFARPAPAPAAAPAAAPGPIARFGNRERIYGKPLVDLEPAALEELITAGEKYLADSPAGKYAKTITDNLVEVRAELEKRKAAAAPAVEGAAADGFETTTTVPEGGPPEEEPLP